MDPSQVQRVSAFKTVDTFAGITKRRLWLRDSTTPRTDGFEIGVPLSDPAMYKMLGHQLAHILFQTSPQARKVFIEEYASRIADLLKRNGKPLEDHQQATFRSLLHEILSTLECHRVESLWGLLYPGSYHFGRQTAREDASARLAEAHNEFTTFFSLLETGVDVPSGQYDRFRPYCVEAFAKTERRGPSATLMVAKWLVSHLVAEMLREARDQPPPPDLDATLPDLDDPSVADGGAEPKDTKDEKDQDGDEEDPNQSPAGAPRAEDQEGTSVGNSGQLPEEGAEPKNDDTSKSSGPGTRANNAPDGNGGESDEEGEPDNKPGSGKWTPPKTDSTAKERAEGLRDFIDRAGKPKSRHDDIKEPPAPEKGAAQAAAQMVSEALKADVTDAKAMQAALDASKQPMDKMIQRARSAFVQQMTHDEWLRRDAHAKVVFRDVRARDVVGLSPFPLSPEDLITVQKLRALFNRVMGRRRILLEDTGTEVDVESYIERLTTGANVPVFKREARGQGFKPLLLVDRSGSMGGEKQRQAERACRIIARALWYPFVDLHIWGFNSLADGQVDIARFDPHIEVFDTSKSGVGGTTPFHLAIRVAQRFLERGSEVKHLFAITDGFPVYSRKDGKAYSTRQLITYVRDEVQEAKARGIATTGIIIGTQHMAYSSEPEAVYYDLGPRELRFMFGLPRFWRQMHPDTFGNDLVRVVASSFLDYLNRA